MSTHNNGSYEENYFSIIIKYTHSVIGSDGGHMHKIILHDFPDVMLKTMQHNVWFFESEV